LVGKAKERVMGKTFRRDERKDEYLRDGAYNSHKDRKELKRLRKEHIRKTRRDTKHGLQDFDPEGDVLPDYPHTSGWESN
jgi:hypothetical protein